MELTKTKALEGGVTQTDYVMEVAGSRVPFVVWAPEAPEIPGRDCKVLIGMAHGGSLHKKTEEIRTRAIRYARDFGWVSFAVDAPGHGDRISREEAQQNMRETALRVNGDPSAPRLALADKIAYLDELADEAVPEWRAVLDSILDSDLVSHSVAIGYWGISMGTSVGIPLLAADSRYECAVLGLSELLPGHAKFEQAANAIDIPLRLIFQWDDPIRDRSNGINLFEALGSQDKSLHINTGGHSDFPRNEADSWDEFFCVT